uniref:Variant surface glycoprotein 1125.4219 n=1 Tax=Trypanosoma brucei TaxID=5691 RepID=A0A1J0RAK0_9TRYP|nr:variant surface glycoprotein 1125.4219 [Trypanosoma brucei]
MPRRQQKGTLGKGRTPNKLCLLAATLISFTATTTADQVVTTAHTAITSFCTENHYYDTLIAGLKNKVDPAKQQAEKQMKEVKVLTLATARYGTTSLGPIYACLLGEATARAAALATTINSNEPTVTAALATLTAKQAELRTHRALTASKSAATGRHAPPSDGTSTLTHSSARSCQAEAQPEAKLDEDCSSSSDTDHKIQALQTKIAELTQLKVTKQTAIQPAKITATADATNPSGETLKASTTNKFCIDNSASGTDTAATSTKSIAIRPLALTTTSSSTEINVETASTANEAAEPKAWHVRLLTTDKALAKAFKAAQKADAAFTKLISEETSGTLSNTAGCQVAAAAALEGKLLDSKTKTEINKLALKHLGEEGKNIGEQFFTKLKNDKITIPTTADPITGTTEELAHSGHFQKVLAFFNAKNKMDQGGKPQSLHQKAVKNLRNRSKKKTKMGIIKQPQPNAKPLKRKIVTKQNAIGTQTKNSAKLKRERLLFQL